MFPVGACFTVRFKAFTICKTCLLGRFLEREVNPEAAIYAEANLSQQEYDSLDSVAAELSELDLPNIDGVMRAFLGNAQRDEDDAVR